MAKSDGPRIGRCAYPLNMASGGIWRDVMNQREQNRNPGGQQQQQRGQKIEKQQQRQPQRQQDGGEARRQPPKDGQDR